jgi:nicotinamidase-related amidase
MSTSTIPSNFIDQSKEFLSALVDWESKLPSISWSDLQTEAQQRRIALISVDMINGFCHEGVLSSPRVKNIIPAVVAAFKAAYSIGVREFVLAQDCHTPESVEFSDFPPHCQTETSEADTIPELANLPFANLYQIVSKNSLNAFHGTDLGRWLEARHHFRAAVIVGDCTDLCVHQMALHLKLYANAYNLKMRVIVPENAVQTYDMPVETANAIGALPHDGDFMHLVFLYHMRLNGVEVVREIVSGTSPLERGGLA